MRKRIGMGLGLSMDLRLLIDTHLINFLKTPPQILTRKIVPPNTVHTAKLDKNDYPRRLQDQVNNNHPLQSPLQPQNVIDSLTWTFQSTLTIHQIRLTDLQTHIPEIKMKMRNTKINQKALLPTLNLRVRGSS